MDSALQPKRKLARRSQAERTDHTITMLRTCALELLLEGGVAALNLAKLGDRAGYSRGIVHYHFGSKEELLIDLLEGQVERSLFELSQVDGVGLAGVIGLIRAVENVAINNPHQSLVCALLLNEAAVSSVPRMNELAVEYNARTRAALEAFALSEPIASTALSPEDFATLILATLRGIHHQWLAERETFDAVAALRAFGDVLEKIYSGSLIHSS